jgi:hypothetical protein
MTSRFEETDYEDYCPHDNPHYANQSYCMNCFCDRTNTVGHISTVAKAWFCSGECLTYYSYKNKMATYAQEVVVNLLKAGQTHYCLEILNRRRRHLGLSELKHT